MSSAKRSLQCVERYLYCVWIHLSGSFEERLLIGQGSIGDQLAIGWRLFWRICILQSQKDLQLFGDWLATARWQDGGPACDEIQIVCNHCDWSELSRQPVANLSTTSPRPHCDPRNPFYDQFGRKEASLAARKSSCNQLVPATCRRPVSELPVLHLQPPCDRPKS